jgi:hypothetical protein
MSNRFGQAYGFTAFSAILGGDYETGISHDVALRRELHALNAAVESPFASVPTTHLARWVVIPEAPFESIPAKVDHFQSKYLLFTSNFDGGGYSDDVALIRYLDALHSCIPGVIARLYSHCVGFPGVGDPSRFCAFFKACQIETTFLFGAYADASVDQVLRALVAQKRVGDFISEHQEARSSPTTLQSAFARLRTSLGASATPRPGGYL